ncbi:MAG: tetratricopeptide repeat protein, partial [Candidatus Sericytochromatia bacterium]|nr:tetratricopeptide repeat protein [Candidatus Tanganyikabacteria bacterium]
MTRAAYLRLLGAVMAGSAVAYALIPAPAQVAFIRDPAPAPRERARKPERQVPAAPSAPVRDVVRLRLDAGDARRSRSVGQPAPAPLRLLAPARDGAGRTGEAARDFEPLVALSPADEAARTRLAYLLVAEKDFARALPHFRFLAELRRGDPDLAADCAFVAHHAGRTGEAIDLLRERLKDRPYHPRSLSLLATLVAPTAPAEAAAALAVLNAGPGATAESLAFEGELRQAAGESATARDLFDRALAALGPAEPRTHREARRKADLLARVGRAREAALTYTHGLAFV